MFNLTRLSKAELDELAQDLPPMRSVPVKNITALLTPIDKNYPFVLPTYAYVLMAVGGTIVVMLVLGVMYYMKYKRAKAAQPRETAQTRKFERCPPSKEEIEMVGLTTQRNDVVASPKRAATPLLVQQTLEKEFNIDFTRYEEKRKMQKLPNVI